MRVNQALKTSFFYLPNTSDSTGPWAYSATLMQCTDTELVAARPFRSRPKKTRSQLMCVIATVVCQREMRGPACLTPLVLLHVPNA